MHQYNVDFFDRSLNNVYHDYVAGLDVTEDYISIQNNTINICDNEVVNNGQFINITGDDGFTYFGIVTNTKSDEGIMTVSYKSFLSVFDENIVFDTALQKQSSTDTDGVTKINPKTLENTLKDIIDDTYVTVSDTVQRLPISVSVATNTKKWGFNLATDTTGMHYCIVGLYSVLIVNAMKKYGVAVLAEPDFIDKVIYLTIKAENGNATAINIDGDLNNVKVTTLKLNDRPNGTNKLSVYNVNNYTDVLDFYVYTDRSWGVTMSPSDKTRITPVVRDVKSATPDSSIENETDAFVYAALDVAYGVLSGLTWDNLIELDVSPNDPSIKPMSLNFGQKIHLWYKGGKYTSILTGRHFTSNSMKLIFGSERISFTKKYKK